MGVDAARCRQRANEQLVVGERIRARPVDDLDRDAAVLLLGERACRLGLGEEPVDRGLCGRRSVTPTSTITGRAAAMDRSGRASASIGSSVTADGDVPVEPRRDVLGQLRSTPLVAEHLVDDLDELVVERLIEVDALDRRESSEQLTQGGVLLRRRLDAQLDVERRIGRTYEADAKGRRPAR